MAPTEWKCLQGPASIFWLTCGRHPAKPHANILVGALRTARNETLDLNVQFVDVEDCKNPDASLVETLLVRFRASTLLEKQHNDMAFSQTERELVTSREGEAVVQMATLPDMNDRYNSSRRPIFKPLNDGRLCLSRTNDAYVVQREFYAKAVSGECNRITDSHQAPVLASGCGPFILALGNHDNSEQFISLSSRLPDVHWLGNSETLLKVKPVDSSILFSADRTYWLVGLAGSLGLSLNGWYSTVLATEISKELPAKDSHKEPNAKWYIMLV
ncbi:hypothetical protein B0I35DRAFT_414396 [Stachybotrys elegans]|uniref:Uncharacterized protein n=1 Tax=Stachybotrys elegans TaxID=80388 RepID=A0A8K0WKV4_9HYPO|nr:hypothetical protein B0I35DRAFT_414396 [Stachybotrys elegans]